MNKEVIVADAVVRVLEVARQDWVQLLEIQGHLTESAAMRGLQLWHADDGAFLVPGEPISDPWLEERISLGMRVVRELICSGKMVPGYIPDGFQPWTGSRDEWISRIEAGWREYGTSLDLNDVCWFALADEV